MSNRYLNLFANLDFPKLTAIDRLVLIWHCNRHNDEKGKAWPKLDELLNITGVHEKSVSRSRTRLRKLGALIQITKACEGRQAEYAVNENWLLVNQRVTEQLPVITKGSPAEPSQVTLQGLLGNTSRTKGSPDSYPKPIKPIKPIKPTKPNRFWLDEVSFKYYITDHIPHEHRATVQLDEVIDQKVKTLIEAGYSDQQIFDKLNYGYWEGIHDPSWKVNKLLDELKKDRPRRASTVTEPFNDDPWASSAPSGGGWDIEKSASEMFNLPE